MSDRLNIEALVDAAVAKHAGGAELLTMAELAAALKVSKRTVERRVTNGSLGIPVLDIATGERRKLRVRRSDLAAYYRSRLVG